MLNDEKGILFVLSGPSGVGKGTVCSALRKSAPELVYSVSATTRAPRDGEVEGVNYFYKSKEQFLTMIQRDEMLEWAEYVGNYYGTPRKFVQDMLESGKDVILEIEVQGALKVKEKLPDAVFIFLLPPNLEELRSRIVLRGTESESVIQNRLNVGLDEIKLVKHYDYAVVNDQVDKACERIKAIMLAEHCRKERMMESIRKAYIEESIT